MTQAYTSPGSPEAVKKGCLCPILDNHHGKGYKGIEGIFIYNGNCPLHAVPYEHVEQITEEESNA